MHFSGAQRISRLRLARDLAAAAVRVCQMSPSHGKQTLKCACHMPSDPRRFDLPQITAVMLACCGLLL